MDRGILLTGIHRSGSTWLGEMLALSNEVGYIHEPFNLSHGKCICGFKTDYWYENISDNDIIAKKHFQHVLSFGPQLFLSDLLNFKVKKLGVKYRRKQFDLVSNLKNHRPLLKDPLALLSADWLYKQFNLSVVISIRHPAAFVDSLVRKNWEFDFNHLLSQENLMKTRLVKWKDEINLFVEQEKELFDQAILLWNIMYDVVSQYQEEYPDWHFVRHEDLSADPVFEIGNLYNKLGLTFTKTVEHSVNSFTKPDKENSRQRDSRANIYKWKDRLSQKKIDIIKDKTGQVASKFYTEENW